MRHRYFWNKLAQSHTRTSTQAYTFIYFPIKYTKCKFTVFFFKFIFLYTYVHTFNRIKRLRRRQKKNKTEKIIQILLNNSTEFYHIPLKILFLVGPATQNRLYKPYRMYGLAKIREYCCRIGMEQGTSPRGLTQRV